MKDHQLKIIKTMMVSKSVSTTVGICAFMGVTGVQAQGDDNSNQLRMDFSYNNAATAFDDGFDRLTVQETMLDGVFTLQTASGLYGRVGFGRANVYEVEFNGRSVSTDDDYSARLFGFGYRVAYKGQPERFWGLGYENAKVNESGSDAANTVLGFWEKDNARRYGIIDVAYSSSDDAGLLALSGRHVWFLNSGMGLGVTWGVGTGTIETDSGFSDVDVGVANLGAVLMFRPRL